MKPSHSSPARILLAAAFLLATLLHYTGCGNSGNQGTATSDSTHVDSTAAPTDEYPGWATFEDSNIKLRYPADWPLARNLEEGYLLVIEDTTTKPSDAAAYIRLYKTVYKDLEVDLDSVVATTEKYILSKTKSNPKIISSKALGTGDNAYHEWVYSLQILPAEVQPPTRYISYSWVMKGIRYDLESTPDDDHFDARMAIISKMAKSLTWKMASF